MRKIQSTPCFSTQGRRSRPSSAATPPAAIAPHGSSPPTESMLVAHLAQYVPATLYQFTQCMETYGPPEAIVSAPVPAPPLVAEETLKSTAACLLTPDEPNETTSHPMRRMDDLAELNERFNRLFLSVRRRRRRQTI